MQYFAEVAPDLLLLPLFTQGDSAVACPVRSISRAVNRDHIFMRGDRKMLLHQTSFKAVIILNCNLLIVVIIWYNKDREEICPCTIIQTTATLAKERSILR
jgi:hypothetical protein